MRPELLNPQVLAYLGDSVFEVMVRDYLVEESNLAKVNELQKEAVKFVSAKAHYDFIKLALENNWLSENEVDIFKRARNNKIGRKDSVEHSYSTGFEAIIGHLYLKKEQDRINELFELFKSMVK